MKKFFVTLVFMAATLVANAQLFVAGSVSANYHDESPYESYRCKMENGFSVIPAVGYMIPGKSYGFGVGLGYTYAAEKKENMGGIIVSKEYTNTFDFGPFFRYAYAKFEKITLYVDAKIPVSISDVNERIGKVVEDVNDVFTIGARLIPGLTYKFNSHILFTTEIGLLSINCMHTKETSPNGIVKKSNDYNLGANTRQIASFGFVYLF